MGGQYFKNIIPGAAGAGPPFPRNYNINPPHSQIVQANAEGYVFDTDTFAYIISPTANIAPGGSSIATIQITDDATFQWELSTGSLVLDNSGAGTTSPLQFAFMTVQIMDGGPARNIFNIPVHWSNVVGIGQFPHILPIPKRFAPRSTIQISFTNIDTARTIQAASQLVLHGRKLFNVSPNFNSGFQSPPRFSTFTGPDGNIYGEDYFAYTLFVGALNAATAIQLPILIDGDSDFEWIQTTSLAGNNSTTGQATNNVQLTVQVRDTMAQRDLYWAPIDLQAMSGTGQQPFINPQPRIFAAKSQIAVTLNNFGADTLNNIFLTFEGRKIWQAST